MEGAAKCWQSLALTRTLWGWQGCSWCMGSSWQAAWGKVCTGEWHASPSGPPANGMPLQGHTPTSSARSHEQPGTTVGKGRSRAEPDTKPRGARSHQAPCSLTLSSSCRVLGAHLHSCQPLQRCHSENGECGRPWKMPKGPVVWGREGTGWARYCQHAYSPTCPPGRQRLH